MNDEALGRRGLRLLLLLELLLELLLNVLRAVLRGAADDGREEMRDVQHVLSLPVPIRARKR